MGPEQCMKADLLTLVGRGHAAVIEEREKLVRDLAADCVLADLAKETVGLTLLAGAGTRWVKSLAAAKAGRACAALGKSGYPFADFPLEAPRGLFPVGNYITSLPRHIPLAAYAVDALKNLGRQVLVVRGWEEEIRKEIMTPLGIKDEAVYFRTQAEGPKGKVLGHGDAAWQSRDGWLGSRYVIANFGGDANSPLTVLASLLVMAELDKRGNEVDLLLPVAKIRNPAYPVLLDEEGLPRSFGHDKLGGEAGKATDSGGRGGLAYTNVGIRLYRTRALAEVAGEIRRKYWREGSGYAIPGNDPLTGEFALDNVDAVLAGRGRARILALAQPEELTPAKSCEELGNFEEAARKVRVEWDSFRLAFDAEYPSNPWTGKGVERS